MVIIVSCFQLNTCWKSGIQISNQYQVTIAQALAVYLFWKTPKKN